MWGRPSRRFWPMLKGHRFRVMLWADAYEEHKRRPGSAIRLVSVKPRRWEVVDATSAGGGLCPACRAPSPAGRRWCADGACQRERVRRKSATGSARLGDMKRP